MSVQLNVYLSFDDNARQAMEFYQSVFGGTVDMQTFQEAGRADDPADADKLMHSQLHTDNGMVLMASDTSSQMEYKPGTNFSLSLSGTEEAALKEYFEKLSDGGSVTMPLAAAPWGDMFGMLRDKFGIGWMVNISKSAPAA